MTPENLRDHLRTLGISDEDRAFALELFGMGAGRKVGAYALDNMIVDFYSKKCRDVRRLESHTVEQTCAFELELDPDVIAYGCQVACQGIRRGNHVTTAHADFFVIRRNLVEVIECKPVSKLQTLVKKKPSEWVLEDGKYRNLVYERWAASHNIGYRVWASPAYISRYHRNLQFIYQSWDQELSLVRREGFSSVQKKLTDGPKSIALLMEEIPWFNAGVAAGLIADRLLYGPVEQVPITDTRNFLLSLDPEQALSIAAEFNENIINLYLDAKGKTSFANATDLAKGRTRLRKLDQLIAAGCRIPKSMRALHKNVSLARAEGRNPLDEAITKYARSGNRSNRLTAAQSDLVTAVIKTHWLKGLVKTISDLHRELQKQCEMTGIIAPGRKALTSRVRSTSRAVRDLATGGKRKYQAGKERSDSRNRSGTALAVHAVLHIDATKVDHRTFIQGQDGLEDQCPLLYCGRDEASSHVMAHAFVFGPARRDGPLILIRNYVRKHGRAPHSIVIDRGSDLQSGLSQLCIVYGISLLIAPTGGSRFNSQCETIQGQINAMVSHRLIGSTKPDQAGRNVDGKFKSRSTARMDFSITESEISNLLYSILPDNPVDGFVGARERFSYLQSISPNSGIPIVIDDDFLFHTSIKLNSTSFERTRGFRHCGRSYTNADLATRPDDEKMIEGRRDPEDTTFVWIQTTKRRYKAWCSKVSEIGHYPPEDRYFEAMWDQFIRPELNAKREEIQRMSYERTSMANAKQRALDANQAQSNEGKPPHEKAHPPKSRRTLTVNFDELPDLVSSERYNDH